MWNAEPRFLLHRISGDDAVAVDRNGTTAAIAEACFFARAMPLMEVDALLRASSAARPLISRAGETSEREWGEEGVGVGVEDGGLEEEVPLSRV